MTWIGSRSTATSWVVACGAPSSNPWAWYFTSPVLLMLIARPSSGGGEITFRVRERAPAKDVAQSGLPVTKSDWYRFAMFEPPVVQVVTDETVAISEFQITQLAMIPAP